MKALDVLDHGEPVSVTFDDLLKYHGRSAIGGVAHGFKVMERAFPLLCDGAPPKRYDINIETAFPGPGARDAFEMVTRAVTGDRFVVDPSLARPERGDTLARYVFRVAYRRRAVTLTIREGFVVAEFIRLARTEGRTAQEEVRLTVLKAEMAERLLARPATEVYDVDPAG